jgi:hypothetical protein
MLLLWYCPSCPPQLHPERLPGFSCSGPHLYHWLCHLCWSQLNFLVKNIMYQTITTLLLRLPKLPQCPWSLHPKSNNWSFHNTRLDPSPKPSPMPSALLPSQSPSGAPTDESKSSILGLVCFGRQWISIPGQYLLIYTGNPWYTSGVCVNIISKTGGGGALQVQLGGVDSASITNSMCMATFLLFAQKIACDLVLFIQVQQPRSYGTSDISQGLLSLDVTLK